MINRIDPLPIRYEAFQIEPFVDQHPMVLQMETDQGPVSVRMELEVFRLFVEKANLGLARLPPPTRRE